jgi:hypothetical protein
MAKYRLLAPFVTHESQLLETGVEIGMGTHYSHAYPDGSPRPPSPIMHPLDAEAENFLESQRRGIWPPVHPEKPAEPVKPKAEEPEEDDEPDRARAKHRFEPPKKGR